MAPDLGNQEVEDLAKRVKAANDGLSLAFGEWQKKKVNVTEIGRMRLWIRACRFMLDVSELCGLTLNESDVSLDRCLCVMTISFARSRSVGGHGQIVCRMLRRRCGSFGWR